MNKVKEFFKKKKSSILSFAASLGLLLLAGLVGVGCAMYQTYKPQTYMDTYYEAFLNESYPLLYKSANIKEGTFISQDAFTQMMVNDLGYEETDAYSITECVQFDTRAKSTVSFKDSETGDKVNWVLELKKSDKKKFLFFNEWDVNLDDFIIEDVKITAPQEVIVALDDVNITEDKVAGVKKTLNEETGVVTYIIDRMFAGSHNLLFVGTHTTPETEVVQFDDQHKYFALRTGTMKSEHQEAMSESVKKIVLEMYNSAFTNAGIDKLKPLFASNDATLHNINTTYTGMYGAVNKDDGTTLLSIDITDYTIAFDRYEFDKQVDVSFYYTGSYTAKGERTIADGVRDNYEGANEAQAIITFEYIDEKWQAVAIDMNCIDYSVVFEEEEE